MLTKVILKCGSAWRYSCSTSDIQNGNSVGNIMNWNFDGNVLSSTEAVCSTWSDINQYSYGVTNDTLMLPNPGPQYLQWQGNAWDSNLVYGSGSWSISLKMDLNVRQDTGKPNSAPTIAFIPALRAVVGCDYDISFKVSDMDLDPVRCRWATDIERDECGGVCGAFPDGTLKEDSCKLSYKLGQAGLYAVAIMVEDFAPTDNTFTKSLSSIPLQFVIHATASNLPCNKKPTLHADSPADGSSYVVETGSEWTRRLIAVPSKRTSSIQEITTTAPLGATLTPLIQNADGNYELSITWPATKDNLGLSSMCFFAIDVNGIQSDIACFDLVNEQIRCAEPVLFPNTVVSTITGYGYLDTVTYECAVHAVLESGNMTMTCTAKGWSGSSPMCTEIRCAEPALIPNTVVSSITGFRYLDTVTYECAVNAALEIGTLTKTCTSKGWASTDQMPLCAELRGTSWYDVFEFRFAVDGKDDTCFLSGFENEVFFTVLLKTPKHVSAIRVDGFAIDNLSITTMLDHTQGEMTCATWYGEVHRVQHTLTCHQKAAAKFVTLRASFLKPTQMKLCELEIL